ncbi:hypothetical protein [Gloeocapsopsis dulcis]|uniref:hypothetical protein n=1 Tax=Gloeocapsopsis dulcis TaxID=2859516 RepID=UPI0012DAC3C4|nr:hypothetical protein [Gloeocapsopsis dulcis]WNN87260.1 hypothetical protein P0S91_13015 [Gloeocapsopsis dulcis]
MASASSYKLQFTQLKQLGTYHDWFLLFALTETLEDQHHAGRDLVGQKLTLAENP